MKRMKGRLLAILMSLAVAFTVMPMTGGTAHAASAVTIDGVKYTLNEENGKKTATVSGHTNEFKGSLFIPGAVSSGGADYAVTGIGERAFKECKSLTSVTIPGSVTGIADDAFRNSSLTDITFVSESTLDYIGRWAFQGCEKLRSITIPKSVTSIGDEAFIRSGLRSVTFEPGSTIERISLGLFSECRSLTSIAMPKSVTSIWDDAFKNTGLTSVVIPSGVNRIKSNAFRDCRALDPIYYVGQKDQWDEISKHSNWTGGRDIPVRFVEKAAEVPTGKTFIYNGKEQTGVEAGEGYFLEGPTKATNAGTYTVTARKHGGYDVWTDGTTADSKEITWEIRSAAVTVTGPVTAPAGRKLTYNGKTQTGVAAGTGYTLSGTASAVNAGSYTATATLDKHTDSNYEYVWADETTEPKTITWKINKAANSLNVKGKAASVKFKKLKKKHRTLAAGEVMAFRKMGQGKLAYVKKSGSKKITINKKTGNVTVKKGLKKGKYKVKINVSAAGNKNYKKATKPVNVTIRVR